MRSGLRSGFTLVELLVVVAIIGLLGGILLPGLTKARRKARQVRCMNHQKQIVFVQLAYEGDHGKYSPTVATIGWRDWDWSWVEPMTMTTFFEYKHKYPKGNHRATSEYLGDYVDEVEIMFCPSAPKEYPFMHEAWKAGDSWDNPMTGDRYLDPFYGMYCFYWGYIGVLPDCRKGIFRGPLRSEGGSRRSKLLVSDYFGKDYWRVSGGTYASCERFYQSGVTGQYATAMEYWYCLPSDKPLESMTIRLHAGYTDGHVECYGAKEVMEMRVSSTPDGKEADPMWAELYGDIFIPRKAIY